MKRLFVPLLITLFFSSLVLGNDGMSCPSCDKEIPNKPSCHQPKETKKSCCDSQKKTESSCHHSQSSASDCQISCQADQAPAVEVTFVESFKKDTFELKVPTVVQILPEIIKSPPIYYIHDPSESVYSDSLSLLKPIRLLC